MTGSEGRTLKSMKTYTRTTDSEGRFSIPINLAKGDYVVTVHYGGGAFLNEDCPPYYCDFGEDNPVICAVKMRKMKEYKKEKLRSCLDG